MTRIISLMWLLTALAAPVWAAPITFTFAGVDGLIDFDGGGAGIADLTVILTGDTSNLVLGAGLAGGDLYANLLPRYSSNALGFSDVAGADLMNVEIGGPLFGAAFVNAAFLVLGTVHNGVFALTPDITTWDRVSDFGPAAASAVASGPIFTSLSTGQTLVWANFDELEPFGDASFSARVVPEPSTLLLLMAGTLGLMGHALRRR